MWVLCCIKLSWHSCSVWDKLGWLNWLLQLICEGLSSFNLRGNLKGFFYLYTWSCSLLHNMFYFFFNSTYTIYTFSSKKFWVARYLYTWTHLQSQSKIHHKIVDRTIGCVKCNCVKFDMCQLFGEETFINNQNG